MLFEESGDESDGGGRLCGGDDDDLQEQVQRLLDHWLQPTADRSPGDHALHLMNMEFVRSDEDGAGVFRSTHRDEDTIAQLVSVAGNPPINRKLLEAESAREFLKVAEVDIALSRSGRRSVDGASLLDEELDAKLQRVKLIITNTKRCVESQMPLMASADDAMYAEGAMQTLNVGLWCNIQSDLLFDVKSQSKQQLVLNFVLQKCAEHGLRKFNGKLYKQLFVVKSRPKVVGGERVCCADVNGRPCGRRESDHQTPCFDGGRARKPNSHHAFKPACERTGDRALLATKVWVPIHKRQESYGEFARFRHTEHLQLQDAEVKSYLRAIVTKQTVPGVWGAMTHAGVTADYVCKEIINGREAQLPQIVFEDCMWAGLDGVYMASPPEGAFVEEEERTGRRNPKMRASEVTRFEGGMVVSYEALQHAPWAKDLCISKFFDGRFDPERLMESVRGERGDLARRPSDTRLRPRDRRFKNYVELFVCVRCGQRRDQHCPRECERIVQHAAGGCAECDGADGRCPAHVERGATEADFVLACARCRKPDDACACSRFDPYVLISDAWRDIPTPFFHSILRYQVFSDDPFEREAIEDVMYAMLGRTFFPLKKNDDWQVCLLIKGQAGNGKSTIADVMKMAFNEDEVGILSNNAQETFALSSLIDSRTKKPKKLVMCTEVKSNFPLSQAEFQEMCSGANVSLNLKHQTAITVRWDRALILFGNENPGKWNDTSNSIGRRMVVFEFTREVTDSFKDEHLLKRIRNREIPFFIRKCIMAYRAMTERARGCSIWGKDTVTGRRVVPQYFVDQQSKMRADTNPLTSFMQKVAHGRGYAVKEKVEGEQVYIFKHPRAYIKQSTFVEHLNRYINKEIGIMGKQKWSEDKYRTDFQRMGLKVVKSTRRWWESSRGAEGQDGPAWSKVEDVFITGIGFSHHWQKDLPKPNYRNVDHTCNDCTGRAGGCDYEQTNNGHCDCQKGSGLISNQEITTGESDEQRRRSRALQCVTMVMNGELNRHEVRMMLVALRNIKFGDHVQDLAKREPELLLGLMELVQSELRREIIVDDDDLSEAGLEDDRSEAGFDDDRSEAGLDDDRSEAGLDDDPSETKLGDDPSEDGFGDDRREARDSGLDPGDVDSPFGGATGAQGDPATDDGAVGSKRARSESTGVRRNKRSRQITD